MFSGAGGSQEGGSGGSRAWQNVAAATTAAVVVAAFNDRMNVYAKEDKKESLLHTENRVRQFSAPDAIFNYFASYLYIGKTKESGKVQRSMMMTPLEFYAAITPDCRRLHGVGAGVHVEVTEQEIRANKVAMDKSPVKDSVLNRIGEL